MECDSDSDVENRPIAPLQAASTPIQENAEVLHIRDEQKTALTAKYYMGAKLGKYVQQDSVSEWLRRSTRNRLGSARTGSNPVAVVYFFSKLTFSGDHSALFVS